MRDRRSRGRARNILGRHHQLPGDAGAATPSSRERPRMSCSHRGHDTARADRRQPRVIATWRAAGSRRNGTYKGRRHRHDASLRPRSAPRVFRQSKAAASGRGPAAARRGPASDARRGRHDFGRYAISGGNQSARKALRSTPAVRHRSAIMSRHAAPIDGRRGARPLTNRQPARAVMRAFANWRQPSTGTAR